MSLVEKVESAINKYGMTDHLNSKIVLGLSGGADSIALLFCLLELNYEVCAVHINHGIRREAKNDENFVKELCGKLNVKLKVFSFDIEKEANKLGVTVEEAGRKYRYESFFNVMKEMNFQRVATAHNKNDQAETLLMRLFRGTGLYGLTGIKPFRENIIRPLIECDRDEIEEYLADNDIKHITDKSNEEEVYTRNKIRLSILPMIKKKFNNNIINTLSRTSELLTLENDYLNEIALDVYSNCIDKSHISISKLSLQNKVIIRRVLRIWLEKYGDTLKDITFENILMIEKLMEKQTGKKVTINNEIVVERSYDYLKISGIDSEKYHDLCYELKFNNLNYVPEYKLYITLTGSEIKDYKNLNNVYTKAFYCDRIEKSLELRHRRSGDKISVRNVGTKKLKDYFIDKKVDRLERDSALLIAFKDSQGLNSNILWIIGYITSSEFEVCEKNLSDEKDKIIIQIWEDKK